MSKAEELTLAMASILGGDLLQVCKCRQDSGRCQIPRILVEVHPIRLEAGQPDSLLGTPVARPAIEQELLRRGQRTRELWKEVGSCGAANH